MFLECPYAPMRWTELMYCIGGSHHYASSLFAAGLNAYSKEAVMLAIERTSFTAQEAASAIEKLRSTTWIDAADLLLEKGGVDTLCYLKDPSTTYLCYMTATMPMMQWFGKAGLDPNAKGNMDNQPVLGHFVRYAQKDKIKCMLSIGAKPTQAMIDLAQTRGEEVEYDEPESNYCYEFYEVKKILEAAL
jgi:hypothetical protein